MAYTTIIITGLAITERPSTIIAIIITRVPTAARSYTTTIIKPHAVIIEAISVIIAGNKTIGATAIAYQTQGRRSI
ncbi:hypothetical protein [Methylophaga lonarensis]|uniref:hypothetical protein n=1 Tax=Methylophaga lonarensis TaxID=999151 RepID=UPI003D2B75F0